MVLSEFLFFRSHICVENYIVFVNSSLQAGKEGILGTSLFEGAFASFDPDSSGLILACENLSAANSDTG